MPEQLRPALRLGRLQLRRRCGHRRRHRGLLRLPRGRPPEPPVCGRGVVSARRSGRWSNVVTEGEVNAPGNSVRVAGFSGSYTANKIRGSGTLRSGGGCSWAWDSRLLITTPWGATFSVQPFTQE